jgi:hypothetical protein
MTGLLASTLLVTLAVVLRHRGAAPRPPVTDRHTLWLLPFGAVLSGCLWLLTGSFSLPVLGLALLLAIPGSVRSRPPLAGPGWLDRRATAVAVGLLTMGVVALAWGSLEPVPRVHDEAAYLLQARIFASGRWVAPARPLPEFFEQMHVFVTPFLASKYPPGHSLLLVPGVWLGYPGLGPVLLNGAAGALLFLLARRVAGGAVALVTWLIWVFNPGTMGYRASYLSETATTALWLFILWVLLDWLDRGGRWRSALVGAGLGLGAITRPMTMFCLGIPILLLFARRVWTRRAWPDLFAAAAAGAALLAILPLWSAQTTGDWRRSPYREYSRVYYPYEWTGFGVRPEPPLREMPASMESFATEFRQIHAEHTVSALPRTIIRRLAVIAQDQWGGRRAFLAVPAILGAAAFGPAGWFALASALLVFVGYLDFAHAPGWSPYYLEIQTVLSFATAVGLCGVLGSLLALRSPKDHDGADAARARRSLGPLVGLSAVLVASAVVDVPEARDSLRAESAYQREFQRRVETLPMGRSVVFVRYGPNHDIHRSLVVNEPDLSEARAWIVHDLGDHNAELAQIDPERRAYLYDDARRSFLPLTPTP